MSDAHDLIFLLSSSTLSFILNATERIWTESILEVSRIIKNLINDDMQCHDPKLSSMKTASHRSPLCALFSHFNLIELKMNLKQTFVSCWNYVIIRFVKHLFTFFFRSFDSLWRDAKKTKKNWRTTALFHI